MAHDHFVPQHYLKHFAIQGSPKKVLASGVTPYRFMQERAIRGVCQDTDFYEGDKALNDVIDKTESDWAPVLADVVKNASFSEPELEALRWLTVTLLVRTRKTAEAYKLFQKRLFHKVIQHGIDTGDPSPPPEDKELVDCKGMPGFLWKNCVIPCGVEMQTLACKLLKASPGAFFITSDHPALVLNQFCATSEPHRNFAGFSKSGFQLLLPICPNLCLFFYDPKVYKVGSRRHLLDRLIPISADDVEIVNALQVQSADEYVYFHDLTLVQKIQRLITQNARLRVGAEDRARTLAGPKEGDELLHFQQISVRIPRTWYFCQVRRHVKARVGDRRDPAWSALVEELMRDLERDPNGGNIHARIKKILDDPKSLQNIRLR